jgi:hypothetical protein
MAQCHAEVLPNSLISIEILRLIKEKISKKTEQHFDLENSFYNCPILIAFFMFILLGSN